ncbi:SusC/RagA family TonB-linked outer membrane protein [Spirosoma areae]
MNFRLFTFLLVLLSAQATLAQRTLTGTVTDAKSGETLAGASILVAGTTIGASTAGDGVFKISAPDNASTLVISYIGYVSQKVAISGTTPLTIRLQPDATSLGEVVVTALGIEGRKTQLSYATQRLAAKELNQSRNGDLAQQLSGQVPGLSIGTNSSSGVSSSRIVLRGESSLNIIKNQPLVVLDGVVISNNLDATGQDDMPVDYGNGLTDINPDDILDVSVLKGPKAAALYGTRAANGALVIRTKSGQEKEGIGVSFSTGLAVEEVSRFWDVQKTYGGGFDNVYRSDWGGNYGAKAEGQPVVQNTYLLPKPDATPFLFRMDREGFFTQGLSTNNNLAISTSNDRMYARVSLSYLDKSGFVPNTDYSKTNIGLRLGASLTEKLSVDVSANYSKSGSKNLPVLGAGGQGIINSMIWSMGNFDFNDYRNYWAPGQEGIQQNYFLSWANNPYLIAYENLNGFNRNRVFGNIKATYKLDEHFSFFARIGTDSYDDRRRSRRPSGQNGFALGMYREQDIRFAETNADFLLSYLGKITDKIGVKVDAGANRMDQTFSNGIAQTNALGIRGVYNLGNAADRPVLRQTDAAKRINSVYGSARFDYQNKLYVDVTGRNDWSSTLPLDNNSFFYPSVGVSAVVSELIALPKAVSFAQVRTSWAATGNDTDPLLTQRVFAFGTLPSSVLNTPLLTNPGLRPERTAAFEIGTELRFLSDRIGVEVNYYNNITTDQILQTPVSQASGATSSLINAGKIRNSGVELLLKAKPVVAKDFVWDVSLNWSRNRGTVEELAPGINAYVIAQGPSGGTVEARVGGRMGDIYGRGFARSPQGDIIYDRVTVNNQVIVRPRVGSGIINVGNYNPDWTAGLINSFTYRNINLRVFFDYRKGGSIYTQTGALIYRSGIIAETLPGRESPLTPAGVLQNADGSFSPNTINTTGQDFYRAYYAVENVEANTYEATFLKLREASVGVNLKAYLKKLPIASANLSVFGRNLFTHTKDRALRHFNPESYAFNSGALVPGFEAGQLPSTRTYGFNLSVGF